MVVRRELRSCSCDGRCILVVVAVEITRSGQMMKDVQVETRRRRKVRDACGLGCLCGERVRARSNL